MKDKILYKRNPNDIVMWVENTRAVGEMEFTFDGTKFFNLFQDYPHKLTPEQRVIFDRENPQWAEFFGER